MVCKGFGMKGSHKVERCWKIHPELKPRNMMNGKEERDRGRHREKLGPEVAIKKGKETREEEKKALTQTSVKESSIRGHRGYR